MLQYTGQKSRGWFVMDGDGGEASVVQRSQQLNHQRLLLHCFFTAF